MLKIEPEELKYICENTNELAETLLTYWIYPMMKDKAGLGYSQVAMYTVTDFGGFSDLIIERALEIVVDVGYTVEITERQGVENIVKIGWL